MTASVFRTCCFAKLASAFVGVCMCVGLCAMPISQVLKRQLQRHARLTGLHLVVDVTNVGALSLLKHLTLTDCPSWSRLHVLRQCGSLLSLARHLSPQLPRPEIQCHAWNHARFQRDAVPRVSGFRRRRRRRRGVRRGWVGGWVRGWSRAQLREAMVMTRCPAPPVCMEQNAKVERESADRNPPRWAVLAGEPD